MSDELTPQEKRERQLEGRRRVEEMRRNREAKAKAEEEARMEAKEKMKSTAPAASVFERMEHAPKIKTTHTLTEEETLSHLALKYYGHATPDYWNVIYEANKDVIGDDPNHVAPGMELKIPELPANLKDK